MTPNNGYTGTVGFSVTSNPTIANACYTVTNAAVSGLTPATATVSIITNSANCTAGTTALVSRVPGGSPAPLGVALAGLLAIGFVGRRSRGLKSLVALAFVAVAAMGISGCGSGTVTTPPIAVPTTYAAKGSYTIVVQGTDSVNASNTQFTTFVMTVQ